MIRFVLSRLAPGSSVLEIGCGWGANLWAIAAEGAEAYGIDIRPDAITQTSLTLRKYGLTANLTIGSWFELPYDGAKFDAVVDIVSTQHATVRETSRVLDQIKYVLKPGGLFFSYRLSTKSGLFRNLKKLEAVMLDSNTFENIPDHLPLANNGHTSFWDEYLVKKFFAHGGLNVLEIDRYERTANNGDHVEYLAITAQKPSS